MPPSPSPNREIEPIERAIVHHEFDLQPSSAVSLGLHEYDGRLPDLSIEATQGWAAQADRLLSRLEAAASGGLPPDRSVDRHLLQLLLESPLFDLRDALGLVRDPVSYLGQVSLTAYLSRAYAPAAERVDPIVRTLEAVPRLLETGRRQLKGPLPKPFVDLTLLIGGGLPAHFAEAEEFARSAGRADEVARARSVAEPAVSHFLDWLREEELARASPDFALGAVRYQRLLFVREGIEAPFEEMRRAGEADLARNRARLQTLATADGVSVDELFRRQNAHHPNAAELLPTARRFVDETRTFVVEHRLVTVPDDANCRVESTPVWDRARSTASMDSPGPFERATSEGVYYVTPVDPTWTPTQAEEWLRSFNYPVLRNITVHEVYPGHYLQFLHFRRADGALARKVFTSSSFVEGWAHYAEQLAIEQGLGKESPMAEVAQLHDALLRNCRLLASIGLHTRGMSLGEATDLFMREAHCERLPAEREAFRGTWNPEYFCYTLGKIAILTARERLLSSRFGGDLGRFHDALLGLGCPPVGLLEALLTARSPG